MIKIRIKIRMINLGLRLELRSLRVGLRLGWLI